MVTHKTLSQERGNLYAGGITYFYGVGNFPLLMVGFAIAGVSCLPAQLLVDIQNQIVAKVPGSMGAHVPSVKTAVEQRSAGWCYWSVDCLVLGLGWIGNVRWFDAPVGHSACSPRISSRRG
ncbi:MAG: hypothetical protein U1U88_001920 [Lawsonella clevelandensis]